MTLSTNICHMQIHHFCQLFSFTYPAICTGLNDDLQKDKSTHPEICEVSKSYLENGFLQL